MTPERRYWFVDIADNEDGSGVDSRGNPYWQAFLAHDNCCFPLPIWFPSPEGAHEFIATIPGGEVLKVFKP